MKTLVLSVLVAATLFACTETITSEQEQNSNKDSAGAQTPDNKNIIGTDAVLDAYLAVKNALVKDDGNAAAKAAKDLNKKLRAYGASPLSDDRKKVYADIQEEVLEHSEHIGYNADKLDHQRSHFNELSVVMYDLIKANKSSKVVYKQYCPMYNDKKGGIWLSEIKEIKNPFYGDQMLECGEVKEEIK